MHNVGSMVALALSAPLALFGSQSVTVHDHPISPDLGASMLFVSPLRSLRHLAFFFLILYFLRKSLFLTFLPRTIPPSASNCLRVLSRKWLAARVVTYDKWKGRVENNGRNFFTLSTG